MSGKRPPKTSVSRLSTIVRILVFFAALCVVWTLVYWGSAWLRRSPGLGSGEYGIELLNFVLAFVLFAGIMAALSSLFAARQHDFFTTLSEAMKRIASGDFSVTVPVPASNTLVDHVATNLNLMAESLKRMEEMRQEFISDVSHEIQSPLTSIAGFARALHEESLKPDERHRYLSIIEEESRRLSRLSDGLLKLNSLESRAQEMVLERFGLDAQLRSAIVACEPAWASKKIAVSADLAPLAITADPGMLGQVWSNLLQNAVKFTSRGGTILVRLREVDGKAQVSFADSGIGIAAEDLPFVFDRFYKADRSRSRSEEYSGSGLGLAIAKKIVALHGGAIEAESAGTGQGSTFRVALPIGR